jgi:hypothetical protein
LLGSVPIPSLEQFLTVRFTTDLSLSTLNYAKSRTQELRPTNVEHTQTELLRLGPMNRSFDVIEAIGVLHYLRAPMIGRVVRTAISLVSAMRRLLFHMQEHEFTLPIIRTYLSGEICNSSTSVSLPGLDRNTVEDSRSIWRRPILGAGTSSRRKIWQPSSASILEAADF